jgi:hypothetical protein
MRVEFRDCGSDAIPHGVPQLWSKFLEILVALESIINPSHKNILS